MGKIWIDYITLVVTSAGSIGTAVAALQAKRSADVSAQQFREQTNQHYKMHRPRLVPSNTQLKTQLPFLICDWQNEFDSSQRRFIQSYKNLEISRFFIPVLNVSSVSAVNVTYSFELEGGIDSIQPYSNNDESIHLYFADNSVRQNTTDQFSFELETSIESIFVMTSSSVLVTPSLSHLSNIQPNQVEKIYLPFYFVLLNNIYLHGLFNNNEKPFPRPKLILSMKYRDPYNNKIEDIYRIQLSEKQIQTSNEDNINYVEAWLSLEFIDTSYLVTNK